jgi:hypothetical protein
VAVNQPDIAVTDLGRSRTIFSPVVQCRLSAPDEHEFDVDVANLGFSTPKTTLTIRCPMVRAEFAITNVNAGSGPATVHPDH